MNRLTDKEQLEQALQTVQRLYMKKHKKKQCVAFYTERIQPIYAEMQANEADIGGVISSTDYKHIWQLMNELNAIMWESYMVKGKDFGRQEGYKIMGLLEQWAERH